MTLQSALFDLAPIATKKARHHNEAPGTYICGDVRNITLEQVGGIPFKALIIDPPWEFRMWSVQGNAKTNYDLLSIDDLCNLPIRKLTDPDCVLFLRATNPLLREALQCLDSWGFEYKTKFPWIKTTEGHKLDYGIGFWVRGISEDIMIATRGNISAPRLDGFLGLVGPNVEHSRKPQDIHYLAESTTPGPYLEIFGRYQRPGWAVFGNDNRGLQPKDLKPSPFVDWLR